MAAELRRLVLLAVYLAGSGLSVSAQGQPGLNSLIVAAGKRFFGTATDTIYFNDTSYLAIVNDTSEFGLIVPENSLKWQPTEPTEGNFTFADGDEDLALAKANGQIFRCHTLVWYQQLPDIVANGTWTASTLTAVIQEHISHVVGHYAGACYSWDVVNEALAENGTIAQSVFSDTLGDTFIPIAFKAAAEADPHAKLYYNDFNLEYGGAKTDGAISIVKSLQSAGVRIDGVGFQSHFIVGAAPSRSTFAGVMSQFTALGLEVALTELDIRFLSLPPNDTQEQQQATDYVSVVGACLDVAGCIGVVVWEFTDRHSWIPSTFPGQGDACLWDENLSKKPAYTSVSSLLAAAGTATTTGKTSATANGTTAAMTTSAASGGAGKNGTYAGTSCMGMTTAATTTRGSPVGTSHVVVSVSKAPAGLDKGTCWVALVLGLSFLLTLY